MKKMLKIMAMLLVISAVVFAAGCAESGNKEATDNGAQEEVTNEAPVADGNLSGNETNVTTEEENGSENVSADVAEDANVTGVAAENANFTVVAAGEPANDTNDTNVTNVTDENESDL